MTDLYDRLKEDHFLIEELENTFGCKVARGGHFKLNPVHIFEIPERGLLKENIKSHYGIENIDQYFIPIVVDVNTYRKLKLIDEPTLYDFMNDNRSYAEKVFCLQGHVKRINGHFISYISPFIPIDTAIAHEAIHAYMFKNNPDYSKYSPTLGFAIPKHISPKDYSWVEAVPWVATSEKIDIEDIIKHYVIKKGSAKLNGMELLKRTVQLFTIPLRTAVQSYGKIKENKPSDLPYCVLNNLFLSKMLLQSMHLDQDKQIKAWKTSFEQAILLKEKLGLKEFIRLAGTKHQDEMVKLL